MDSDWLHQHKHDDHNTDKSQKYKYDNHDTNKLQDSQSNDGANPNEIENLNIG